MMIYNYDPAKLFINKDGVELIEIVALNDNKVIAVRLGDVNGGAEMVPIYFVEKPIT